MTIAQADAAAAPDDRLARRNVFVLAFATALAGGNSTVMLATGAITGSMLAPSKSLATLPVSAYVIGQWLSTLPVGALAARLGRRTTYQIGAGFGVLAGLIACAAVLQGSFVLFLVAAFNAGIYAAAHQSYRFAAADTASEAFRPKAIAWVMAGGIFAALFGPQLVILTKDFMPPYLFAVSYLAQAGTAVLAALVLCLVKLPPVKLAKGASTGRPLGEIARQPRFIVAALCGVASFATMSLVMTSAPLAMLDCNFSITEATLGLQWHVLAMFGPSLFTGQLCARYGADRVAGVGLALIAASGIVAIAGITLAHFWISLILLGIGWNFGLIGATTMVTACHRPEERFRVQSFNDFLVFGSLAMSSLLSGALLANYGWVVVNQVIFPVVLAAGAMLIWQRSRVTAAA